eukprot:GHVU01212662.1.p1 GENE.GHVU01212662.1~~GHVU01212662.1.p1  ORF type:complete len:448 (-),score=61.19 GHVU01212662.1:659-1930(-)
MGIEKIESSPYHPQSNGMVESWHRVLKRGLAVLSGSSYSLERATATILLVYRTTPHSSTGQTPSFLATGSHPTLPGLQCLEPGVEREEAANRPRELELLRAQAHHHVCLRLQARRQFAPKQGRGKVDEYAVNDVVLCRWTPAEIRERNLVFGGAKLAPTWSEPRQVIEVLGGGRQLRVQSLWLRTPPRVISAHDVCKVPAETDEHARRANLKYILESVKATRKAEGAPALQAKLRATIATEKEREADRRRALRAGGSEARRSITERSEAAMSIEGEARGEESVEPPLQLNKGASVCETASEADFAGIVLAGVRVSNAACVMSTGIAQSGPEGETPVDSRGESPDKRRRGFPVYARFCLESAGGQTQLSPALEEWYGEQADHPQYPSSTIELPPDDDDMSMRAADVAEEARRECDQMLVETEDD